MTTLVLIGPHGAGKTTLARQLSRDLGWPFHEELGRLMMEAGARPAVGPDATARPHDFDARVLAAELARDAAWARTGGPHRIIETWHLGNLAYALRRNPTWAKPRLATIRHAVQRTHELVVMPVTAQPEALRLRLSEPGEASTLLPFFRDVAEVAEGLARRWDLCVLPHIDTTGPTSSELSRVV